MLCASCGVQLVSETAPLCAYCGSPVKAPTQAQAPGVAPAPVSAAASGTRKKLLRLVPLVAIGLGALIIVGSHTRSISSVLSKALAFNSTAPAPSIHGDSSVISIVRNGVLKDYNMATVGRAFEGTFQNARWSSFETQKGVTVVQFDGTIPFDRLYENEEDAVALAEKRDKCVASLGFAKTLEEYENKKKDVYQLLQQAEGQRYDAYESYDAELQAAMSAKIEAARRNQLAAEQQAIEAANGQLAQCIKNTSMPVRLLPVTFQFILSADRKTFELGYVDKKFRPDRALPFIYH